MTITKIIVPAARVEEGHVVDNRGERVLEVLKVEPWCKFGKVTYRIEIGHEGMTMATFELLAEHNLTYTYVSQD